MPSLSNRRHLQNFIELKLLRLFPNLQSRLATHQSKLDELKSKLDELSLSLTALHAKIASMDAKIASMAGELTDVRHLKSDLAALNVSVALLSEREHNNARTNRETLDSSLSRVRAEIDALFLSTSGLAVQYRGDFYELASHQSIEEYWNNHNVSAHKHFATAEESLKYLEYRNQSYPGYLELMPYHHQAGKVVLDYGCGPGHDLVGFATQGRPSQLIGIDISATSLHEAGERLALHGETADLLHVPHGISRIPLDDRTVDYIHCSGVLMLSEHPERVLAEFRRVLKPGGEIRVMVYNYDSLWVHLYVAYFVQVKNGFYSDRTLREAFSRTTDGEYCPLVHVWDQADMARLAAEAGLQSTFLGAALSLWEMHIAPRRFEAAMNSRMSAESRAFLLDLTIDQCGYPLYKGQKAGIDGCYRLTLA